MRILTLDIETAPHVGYAFQVWDNNMHANQIIKPTYMLSWSAKWLGSKQSSTVYRMHEDADFLPVLWSLLDEADAVVTYNGDKFDMQHINREFVEAGMLRPRPCASIDLLKVVKKMFKFPHNRLDYVSTILLGEKKLQTGGFDLWPAFMDGDEKARRIMQRYNKRDVVLTEKLYKHLRGWIPNHPNAGHVDDSIMADDDIEYQCQTCLSKKTEKLRPRRTRCYAIRVVRCLSCGSISDGKRKKL